MVKGKKKEMGGAMMCVPPSYCTRTGAARPCPHALLPAAPLPLWFVLSPPPPGCSGSGSRSLLMGWWLPAPNFKVVI